MFGAGHPVEMPIAMFQVLMAFCQPKTPRDVFHAMDLDVDLDEFGRVVRSFVDQGMLRAEDPAEEGPDLRRSLHPRIFRDPANVTEISHWLQQGRAVVIPDALDRDFAEAVHRDLYGTRNWTTSAGEHDFFHYRNLIVDRLQNRTAALNECDRLFSSAPTRRFIAELSGDDCMGYANVSAAWYRPGDYALPHDDSSTGEPRSVAFIWYLTKDWQQEWGGSLFWCSTGQYVSPGFNVLVMFRVLPSNVHLVCPVAPSATGKRLTINGFWHRRDPGDSCIEIPPDATVSPRAYGPLPPELSELSPVIVL